MNKEELRKIFTQINQHQYFLIYLKNTHGEIAQGKLKSVDWDNETLVIHSTKNDYDKTVRFNQIEDITDQDRYSCITHEPRSDSFLSPTKKIEINKEVLRKIFTEIRLDKYFFLYIKNTHGEIEQGELKDVNWENEKVLLHSTNYDTYKTVRFDQIERIDDSRTGSGALSSVQTADLRLVGNDWYRGNEKVEAL